MRGGDCPRGEAFLMECYALSVEEERDQKPRGEKGRRMWIVLSASVIDHENGAGAAQIKCCWALIGDQNKL